MWVLDKSAHVRLMGDVVLPADIDEADLAVCEMGELEWLFSARSAEDHASQSSSIREAFPVLDAPADVFARVRRLQRDLAEHRGMWHRTPLPDLFIAETALVHGAGVLHVDRDYGRIAEVRPGLRQRELS